MFKKCLSIFLAGLLILGANTFVFAQSNPNVEKVKASVAKRGTSDKKKVRVKMLDGTKMRGYISQIGDDSFTLTDSKTKQPRVINYRDAKRIESGGLAGGTRLGIIIGAVAAGTGVILLLAFLHAIRDN